MQERTTGKTHFSKERYAFGKYQRFTTKRSETMCLCVHVRFMRYYPKRPYFFYYKSPRNLHAYTRICCIFTFGLGTNVSVLVCCIF